MRHKTLYTSHIDFLGALKSLFFKQNRSFRTMMVASLRSVPLFSVFFINDFPRRYCKIFFYFYSVITIFFARKILVSVLSILPYLFVLLISIWIYSTAFIFAGRYDKVYRLMVLHFHIVLHFMTTWYIILKCYNKIFVAIDIHKSCVTRYQWFFQKVS